jgi:hypothetical protein
MPLRNHVIASERFLRAKQSSNRQNKIASTLEERQGLAMTQEAHCICE